MRVRASAECNPQEPIVPPAPPRPLLACLLAFRTRDLPPSSSPKRVCRHHIWFARAGAGQSPLGQSLSISSPPPAPSHPIPQFPLPSHIGPRTPPLPSPSTHPPMESWVGTYRMHPHVRPSRPPKLPQSSTHPRAHRITLPAKATPISHLSTFSIPLSSFPPFPPPKYSSPLPLRFPVCGR